LWQSLGAHVLGEIGNQKISDLARWGQLKNTHVTKGAILFPRLPELEVQ